MQLINSSIFDKDSEARKRAIEHTRCQKILERDQREKQKFSNHIQTLATHPGRSSLPASFVPAINELTINGLRFKVSDSGSKLLRISSTVDTVRSTPKRAIVGGVTFVRSKNGNLYRSGFVKARRSGRMNKIPEPCRRFSSTGTLIFSPKFLFRNLKFDQTYNAPAMTTDNTTGDDTGSDLSSDEEIDEIDSDDVDSDGFDNEDDFVHF
ncbi:MAG: hypothetical protein Q9187_001626 [Circinaria calcarea]